MVSPAFAVEPVTPLTSATLVMPRVAQFTVMATGPTVGLPSLVLVTAALLLTVPQVEVLVELVMWTWVEALEARSTPAAPPKLRTPPVRDQPVEELTVSMDQLNPPGRVGTVSETLTPWAVPAPELETVTR